MNDKENTDAPEAVARITVPLIQESLDALSFLKKEIGISFTDIVNKSVQIAQFVYENDMIMKEKDGTLNTVNFYSE